MALNGFDTGSFPLNEDASAPSAKGGDGREIPWGGKDPEHPHGDLSLSQVPLHCLEADLLRHWQGCLPALVKQCLCMFHCSVPISSSSAWAKGEWMSCCSCSPRHTDSFGATCLRAHRAEGAGDALQMSSLLLPPILCSFWVCKSNSDMSGARGKRRFNSVSQRN